MQFYGSLFKAETITASIETGVLSLLAQKISSTRNRYVIGDELGRMPLIDIQ